MHTLCFEGGLFNRRVVSEIGLPDPRFFIYWDPQEIVLEYLLAKKFNKPVCPHAGGVGLCERRDD